MAVVFLLGDPAWALALERLSGKGPSALKKELDAPWQTGSAKRALELLEGEEGSSLLFLPAEQSKIPEARSFLRRHNRARRFVVLPSGFRIRGQDQIGLCFRERGSWIVVDFDYEEHKRSENALYQRDMKALLEHARYASAGS